ncbi:MAG: bifunctional DNA-formamidopyrimidine glycosylase/DNA-(apurinic or apyrimidinic site) lyase [Planctomycetales bacterium]|nr:bifunctional DNA-formamidopyrimidine glycosylase/DNA-(apurinic or apyrimidinic site) lyase [Planctomycetales bacterium]
MPELPEVETMCRGLAACLGRRVQAVSTPPCRYRPISIQPPIASLQRRLRGQVVTEIRRLGKRVVLLTAELALILQPKMSGLVVLEQPPDADHVRLKIDFSGQPPLSLLFWDRRGLGTVELIPRSEIESRIVSGRLGPDALAISGEEFARRLSKTARPIKVALLDQKLLAGIGNLYASEMLHMARIHPRTPCVDIGPRKVARLYQAMRSILLTAIAHEGSTLSDGTYRNALNNPGSYQSQHRVYDRAGLTCPACHRGKITRIVQGGRSTFYCPNCQRL